ncbi:CPBP family intramembrane glutamic endopeptidase [Streptomyces sp. NPDC059009]|uniref:CPBP family intramembrane glutamic endopeptidase n=1 Tax=Streptomyces sp. NPDC059009 TaxID=3346694 RepID=UPI003689052F
MTPPPSPPPPTPLPYHRQALSTGRHRWWRPLAGTAVILGAALVLTLLVFGAGDLAGAALDRPQDADGIRELGGIGETAVALLSLAVLTPAVLLAARWTQRRPAGTVSSVTGHLRWRRLGRCLAVALPVSAASLGIMLLLPESSGGGTGTDTEWAGLLPFLTGLTVVCALVPFQAAAEEYVFRGWLVQAVGAWVRSPWIAVLPQALLFAAAHGWGTPWGFADLLVFALVAAYLTHRTGGLEAAIALHILNNLLAMGIASAIAGGLASDETAADMDWLSVAVDAPMVCLYAAAVLRLNSRKARS